MRRHRIIFALFLTTSISGYAAGIQTDSYVPDEYEIKAVFLFQFTKFVDWPPAVFQENQTPLVVGIYGDDPFGAYLDDVIMGETIDGRPLVVSRFNDLDKLNLCHVVFISHSEKNNLGTILKKLENTSILTVGDSPGYANSGVMINLYTRNRKIRFEINRNAAQRASLKISSKLLKLAKLVEAANGK